jgi:osmotically-inducible protein OsmY
MREDREIRGELLAELDWDPQLSGRDIAVSVRGGVVTLAGFVRSAGERLRAEADARRVEGVLGIANAIHVHPPLISRKPDPEIAREIVMRIRSELSGRCESVRVHVTEGRVALHGEVDSIAERVLLEHVAAKVGGIRRLANEVNVRPTPVGVPGPDPY